MPQMIHTLLTQYLSEVQKIYGAHLKSVILLVDLVAEEADVYSDALSELGYEYNVNYNIWVMPVVKNLQHFKQWVAAYPFYTNVQKEGVTLYESA